jgi:hypothetical protein
MAVKMLDDLFAFFLAGGPTNNITVLRVLSGHFAGTYPMSLRLVRPGEPELPVDFLTANSLGLIGHFNVTTQANRISPPAFLHGIALKIMRSEEQTGISASGHGHTFEHVYDVTVEGLEAEIPHAIKTTLISGFRPTVFKNAASPCQVEQGIYFQSTETHHVVECCFLEHTLGQ